MDAVVAAEDVGVALWVFVVLVVLALVGVVALIGRRFF